MPYSDRQQQLEHQRSWYRHTVRKRRADWFEENGPCEQCGSWKDLELDHIDRSTKVHHAIWSWSKERRTVELAKCQALCHSCHLEKTRLENQKPIPAHGTMQRYRSKLSPCRCQPCRDASAAYEHNRRRQVSCEVAEKEACGWLVAA